MFSNLDVGTTMLVTVTGMIIVFLVLLLLIAIINIFGKVSTSAQKESNGPEKKVDEESEKSVTAPLGVTLGNVSVADEDELIAVITAAVYSVLESTPQTSGKKYTIKCIRDSSGRPVWASAGLVGNTKAF